MTSCVGLKPEKIRVNSRHTPADAMSTHALDKGGGGIESTHQALRTYRTVASVDSLASEEFFESFDFESLDFGSLESFASLELSFPWASGAWLASVFLISAGVFVSVE